MLGLNGSNIHRKISPALILRCIISSFIGIFTQLSVLIIPHFFGHFSLLIQFLLSVVVLLIAIMLGQLLRRLLGFRASAPAFVFFHIIFIWSVYISVIRQAVSPLIDILFNGDLVILLIGFFRMLASDPGFVHQDTRDLMELSMVEGGTQLEGLSETARCLRSSTKEISSSGRRVRYCRSCEAYVKGFDHHCPAFGNCVGMRNHGLFMVLLLGFIVTEILYALLSYQWMQTHEIPKASISLIAQSLAPSTMLFSVFQVVWQVSFLAWHVYCVCFNLKTDEWINWRRYPEFHFTALPGECSSEMRFRNPYHKGIFSNLKEFLQT